MLNAIMKLSVFLVAMAFVTSGFDITSHCAETVSYRRLPLTEYCNKSKAGWIGQIVGVSWGGPTEFKWQDKIIPADKMPVWKP